MKRLNFLILVLLCFLFQNTFSQTHWTFYNDSYYKGSQKTYNSGEMKSTSQWSYNSWKSDCCTMLYYFSKDGKVQEKIFCGDVQDFKAELKKLNDLKYGYHLGWKNIQKIRFYCDDNKYAGNHTEKYPKNQENNQNNYNTGNNQKNYENKQDLQKKQDYNVKADYASMDWCKYYGKGNVIFAEVIIMEGSTRHVPPEVRTIVACNFIPVRSFFSSPEDI